MSRATRMIDAFAAKSEDGVFPNISRSDVANGMRARLKNPELIDQASSSLCGPAALMYAVLCKSPYFYVRYITGLYDTGFGALGDSFGIAVRPGPDCRAADPSGELAGVDWVALASLRDSENDFIDYQGPSDKAGGITMPVSLSLWMGKCGFADRKNETNVLMTASESNLKDAADLHRGGHTVCLFCKGDTLRGTAGGVTTTPSHWVVMTREAVISKNNVTMQVFSWGQFFELNMPKATFFSTYFGFVSGKWS